VEIARINKGAEDLRKQLQSAREDLARLVEPSERGYGLALDVTAAAEASGTVQISYVIGDAYWKPVYDFALDTENARVEVVRKGFCRKVSSYFLIARVLRYACQKDYRQDTIMAIDFKGYQYPKSVILYAVFFYVRYGVSYRDLEEIMAERGVEVDHATLNRWVVKFSPLIAANAQVRKKPTAISWRMDETYIKVRGKWTYLYRAVDRDGQTLDFMLSEHRDTAAARRFFKRAVDTNGVPERIAIDKSGANLAGLQSLNVILKFTGTGRIINIIQSKYLNNIVEQDHRFIKKITRPMLGFKAFYSAAATLAGIETAHMIRKGQFGQNGQSPFKQFAALAG